MESIIVTNGHLTERAETKAEQTLDGEYFISPPDKDWKGKPFYSRIFEDDGTVQGLIFFDDDVQDGRLIVNLILMVGVCLKEWRILLFLFLLLGNGKEIVMIIQNKMITKRFLQKEVFLLNQQNKKTEREETTKQKKTNKQKKQQEITILKNQKTTSQFQEITILKTKPQKNFFLFWPFLFFSFLFWFRRPTQKTKSIYGINNCNKWSSKTKLKEQSRTNTRWRIFHLSPRQTLERKTFLFSNL